LGEHSKEAAVRQKIQNKLFLGGTLKRSCCLAKYLNISGLERYTYVGRVAGVLIKIT
jgi:hypothetical protein